MYHSCVDLCHAGVDLLAYQRIQLIRGTRVRGKLCKRVTRPDAYSILVFAYYPRTGLRIAPSRARGRGAAGPAQLNFAVCRTINMSDPRRSG